MIKCFLLEPIGKSRVSLRRFVQADTCPSPWKYHNADGEILGDFDELKDERGTVSIPDMPRVAHEDPRWPAKCDHCNYLFKPEDTHQVFTESLYSRSDTQPVITLREAPAGAIWRAEWMEDMIGYTGPDGRTYICRLPGNHDWVIDSIASNCTVSCKRCGRGYSEHHGPNANVKLCPHGYSPIDDYQHKCWIRQGRAPNFTVSKAGGKSCQAGGGSILVPGYHGFLQNGHLT